MISMPKNYSKSQIEIKIQWWRLLKMDENYIQSKNQKKKNVLKESFNF